jgi:predicted alpha/beta-fold hydrolase
MPVTDGFTPPRLLRSGHAQSLLASLKFRAPWIRRRAASMLAAEQYVELDAGNDVRLTGWYSAHDNDDAPLAILIHGWEGSAQSQYMLSTSSLLFKNGYRVFRFQLRDHGDSHHLNRELFHSCRLDEAVGGVADVVRRFGHDQPVMLGGYSLGGNFSLRIGVRAPAAGINLAAIAAICPVANPAHTLRAMEEALPVYERYFMRKWRRSLRRKRDLFPNDYSDPLLFSIPDMRALTAHLVEHYGYMRVEDYFDGYRITGDRLASLAIPSLVIAAADDPIIPIKDFDDLATPDCLTLVRTRHGGHCGYIDTWREPTYADRTIAEWFDQHRT